MNKIMTLVKKELYELRWILLAGLLLMVVFSTPGALISLIESGSLKNAPANDGSFMVVLFGSASALGIALEVLYRDLKQHTFYFWSSRPIGLKQYLMVKYVLGLSLALCICILPLLLSLMIKARDHALIQVYNTFAFDVLCCHSFSVMAVFSVTFLITILVRHGVHAALLSVSACLVIYFLPPLIPCLEGLSVFHYLADGASIHTVIPAHLVNSGSVNLVLIFSQAYKQFVFVMLLFSLACLILSWVALKRDWRIRMNKHLIAWCLGFVVLVLAGTSAFQLGSNMTCERQMAIPGTDKGLEQGVARMAWSQEAGVLWLYDFKPNWIGRQANYRLTHVDLSATGATTEQGYPTHIGIWPNRPNPGADQVLWSPQHPDRAYLLPRPNPPEGADDEVTVSYSELWTLALDATDANAILHKLELSDSTAHDSRDVTPNLYLHGNTIYAYSKHLLCIDISHPDKPTITRRIADPGLALYSNSDETYESLRTLPLHEMSDADRFDISLNLAHSNGHHAYKDDLLVVAYEDDVRTYRIVDRDKSIVRFEPLGQVRRSPLQRLAGFYPQQIIINGDFAYVLNTGTGIGAGMLAFDIRQPERPRQVGHYSAPRERFLAMAPLPNGNILVGGNNLHIVKPPRR